MQVVTFELWAEENTCPLLTGTSRPGCDLCAGRFGHFPQFSKLKADMSARAVPMPGSVLFFGTAFQIFCGAMLAAGFYRQSAAIGLVVFTLASSLMMLDFWRMEGMERERTLGAFMNNVALCGGLLLAGFSSG